MLPRADLPIRQPSDGNGGLLALLLGDLAATLERGESLHERLTVDLIPDANRISLRRSGNDRRNRRRAIDPLQRVRVRQLIEKPANLPGTLLHAGQITDGGSGRLRPLLGPSRCSGRFSPSRGLLLWSGQHGPVARIALVNNANTESRRVHHRNPGRGVLANEISIIPRLGVAGQ